MITYRTKKGLLVEKFSVVLAWHNYVVFCFVLFFVMARKFTPFLYSSLLIGKNQVMSRFPKINYLSGLYYTVSPPFYHQLYFILFSTVKSE